MNESEFNALADAALSHIEAGLEAALEASDADFDYAQVSAGVLEVEDEDGNKVIINRHGAAQEVWVAAKSGGYHFKWDGALWRNTRDNEELMAFLATLLSTQLGCIVNL